MVSRGLEPQTLRLLAVRGHRSHFGSRYKLGCCVFAGLFWNRAWFKSSRHRLIALSISVSFAFSFSVSSSLCFLSFSLVRWLLKLEGRTYQLAARSTNSLNPPCPLGGPGSPRLRTSPKATSQNLSPPYRFFCFLGDFRERLHSPGLEPLTSWGTKFWYL